MDDKIITIVEAVDELPVDWEGFFNKEVSEEELDFSKEVIKASHKALETIGGNGPQEAVESAVNNIDSIMGKGWTDYIKSILLTFLIDWEASHMEEDEEEIEEIFFPEDLLRIIFVLTKNLYNQNITIENLKFAISYLEENKNATGKDDPSLG